MRDTADFPLCLTQQAVRCETDANWLFNQQISMMLRMGFDIVDLPQNMRALHCLGYYLGNVGNGGHSQFIGNGNKMPGLDAARILDFAQDGAALLDLGGVVTLLDDLRDWMQAHPKEAAAQTGFDGGRDPALDVFDTRLKQVNMIDETAFHAETTRLFDPEMAARVPKCFGVGAQYFRWPQPLSLLRQLAWLTQQAQVDLVPGDSWEASVRKRLVNDRFAQGKRRAKAMGEIDRRLPNWGTASALHVAWLAKLWDELTPGTCLYPQGPLPAGRKKISAAFQTTSHAHKRPLVADIAKDRTLLYWADGVVNPNAPMLTFDDDPKTALGKVSRYLSDPGFRMRWKTGQQRRRREKLRRVDLIGTGDAEIGHVLVKLMAQSGLRDALFQDMEQHDTAMIRGWRLEDMSLGAKPMARWRFLLTDSEALIVETSETGVVIRPTNGGPERFYAAEATS